MASLNTLADLFTLTQDPTLRYLNVKLLPLHMVNKISTMLLRHCDQQALSEAKGTVMARYEALHNSQPPAPAKSTPRDIPSDPREIQRRADQITNASGVYAIRHKHDIEPDIDEHKSMIDAGKNTSLNTQTPAFTMQHSNIENTPSSLGRPLTPRPSPALPPSCTTWIPPPPPTTAVPKDPPPPPPAPPAVALQGSVPELKKLVAEHDSRARETHRVVKAIRKGAFNSEIFARSGENVLQRTSEFTLIVVEIAMSGGIGNEAVFYRTIALVTAGMHHVLHLSDAVDEARAQAIADIDLEGRVRTEDRKQKARERRGRDQEYQQVERERLAEIYRRPPPRWYGHRGANHGVGYDFD